MTQQDIIDNHPSSPFFINTVGSDKLKVYLETPLVTADTEFTFYVIGGEIDLYKFKCTVRKAPSRINFSITKYFFKPFELKVGDSNKNVIVSTSSEGIKGASVRYLTEGHIVGTDTEATTDISSKELKISVTPRLKFDRKMNTRMMVSIRDIYNRNYEMPLDVHVFY